MQWQTEKARDFYVNSGGNYYDDIVGLGDDYQLIETGMNCGKHSTNNKTSNKTNANNGGSFAQGFSKSSWWEKAITVLLIII